ncbi:MAG TPA: hypothetical protein PK657_02400 [Legionella sp.]|nr:hypothetical protein [Legionella sp.]
MQKKLFYKLWLVRLLYIISVRVILYLMLFDLMEHNKNLSLLSWIGVFINCVLVVSTFFTYKWLDRFSLRHLFFSVMISQVILLLFLMFMNEGMSLFAILIAFTFLFVLTVLEVSVFDKSIRTMLPKKDRVHGISLGLVSNSSTYIVPPLVAGMLSKTEIGSVFLCTMILGIFFMLTINGIKSSTKIISTVKIKFNDFIYLESQSTFLLVLQILLSFSLTTIWMNFAGLLALPLVKASHSQFFVGLMISLGGVGALAGSLSLSRIGFLKSNCTTLLHCFYGTLVCIILFLFFTENSFICLGASFMGGVFSYWLYGLAQKISQEHFSPKILAGFYAIRALFSAFLLIIFYLINLYFSTNIVALVWTVSGYFTVYTIIYLIVFFNTPDAVKQNYH